MSDFQEALQRALGATYRLERELGGGGMSRVFVATETALGRRVVIKVLSPTLAEGVSVERFRREIQLAARLQHPHIVPLLAAGEVQLEPGAPALLYFTMPFVDGESLRARLRQGTVPADLATRILREVADALQYAHQQGIVHRDIKPDNILLSANHAVVTDFGVAKALSTATVADAATPTGTVVGTVIGTPAYMAPEQASGDPDIGPAADVYALGVTGYEMLAGRTPFTGTTPRAILAAQLTQEPPVLEGGTSMPAALAVIIRRLLAREPDARPSSTDVVALLEGSTTPTPGTALSHAARKPRWGRHALVAAGVLGALYLGLRTTGLLPGRSLMAEGRFASSGMVLVADVEVPADSSLAGALTEAIRIDMSQSSVLKVMPVSQVRSTLELMQQPPDRFLDPDVAREVAQRGGAKAVVLGRVEPVAGQYVVTLRLVEPESGDDLAAFRETAADSSRLLDAVDRVSKQLRRRIGESLRGVQASPALARVTTSSLSALQAYSRGSRFSDAGKQEEALPFLQRAVVLDTAFAMAWRKLGIVYANLGRRPEAVEALTRAYNSRDRLPELEKRITNASWLGSVARDPERAIPAYKEVLELDSLNSTALNNMGLLMQASGRATESIPYIERLVRSQQAAPRAGAYGLLAYSLAQAGQLDSAVAVLNAGRALIPEDDNLKLSVGMAQYVLGDVAAAESIAAGVLNDPQASPLARRDAALELGAMARTAGRRKAADAWTDRALANAAGSDTRAVRLRLALQHWLEDALVLNRPIPVASVDSARRAMAQLSPTERSYPLVAATYALAGRPSEARAVLAELDAQPESVDRGEDIRTTIEALIAQAEGRKADALALTHAISQGNRCVPCASSDRLRLYLDLGEVDSAMVMGERYLAYLGPERIEEDALSLSTIRMRLGDLYLERGDRQRAARLYQALLDQWRNADPPFEPLVREVKRKLGEAVGEQEAR